jgi:hypothetical protein
MALLACCGDDGGAKPTSEEQGDASMPHDDPFPSDDDCFVPSDCKESEFCTQDTRRCEPRLALDGECHLGLECQPGLFCLRLYDKPGTCKAIPESCKDDICGCYVQDSAPYCKPTASNCDSIGITIYCSEFP